MWSRLGAVAAMVFWGSSFVATKMAVTEVSPVTLIFLRTGMGTLLLIGLLVCRNLPPLPPRQEWRPLALMGLVGIAFHQVLQAIALQHTSAINCGWLVGLTPLWSAILAAVHLREQLSPGKLLGLLAGFSGALLVVTGGRMDTAILTLPSTRGDLLILAGTVNWAVYTVIGHPTLRRLGAVRATAGALLFGWAMLTPWFLIEQSWREVSRLTLRGWIAVSFLGVACSGLGYLFWYGALRQHEASRVAALLYLEPLVTLGAAVMLLGEPVHVISFVGGASLIAGVALVQTAPTRRSGPPEPNESAKIPHSASGTAGAVSN